MDGPCAVYARVLPVLLFPGKLCPVKKRFSENGTEQGKAREKRTSAHSAAPLDIDGGLKEIRSVI